MIPIQRDCVLRTGRRMHREIKAFQRRLEHFKKSLVVVDNENALFWTAITASHTPKRSIQLASIDRCLIPDWTTAGLRRTKTTGEASGRRWLSRSYADQARDCATGEASTGELPAQTVRFGRLCAASNRGCRIGLSRTHRKRTR